MAEKIKIERPESLTSDELMLAISVLTGILPILLYCSVWWFFKWDTQMPTMSEYIYTSAQPFFTGIVFSLGLIFYFYRGYPTNSGPIPLSDNQLANVAGIGAMMVAIFPSNTCTELLGVKTNLFHSPLAGMLHTFGAAIAFGTMSIFFLFYFTQTGGVPKSELRSDKRARNMIYLACGYIIFVCIAVDIFARIRDAIGQVPDCSVVHQVTYVFWLEAIMLAAISIAWFTKFAGERWTKAD